MSDLHAFEAFRVVGSVCGTVPVSVTLLYGVPIVMVATGSSYQLYKGEQLAQIRGGPTFDSPVRAVAQSGRWRFVAEGTRVHGLSLHKRVWTAQHNETSAATMLNPLVTGLLARDELLFCLGDDRRILVRAGKSGSVLQAIAVERSECVREMVLLTGYTNKLLVSTAVGTLHLYNFRTAQCVWYSTLPQDEEISGGHDGEDGVSHREDDSGSVCGGGEAHRVDTNHLSRTSSVGWSGAPRAAAAHVEVTALCASPWTDVIGYGTASGSVVVLDVGSAQVICHFRHDDGAAITALSFRDDAVGTLVSGSAGGAVARWRVRERCLDGWLKPTRTAPGAGAVRVHSGVVHSLVFCPSGGAAGGAGDGAASWLLSAGADNAMRQYRFDTVDGVPVMTRERAGHAGGCTVARFYDADLLLTAGLDGALRVTHLFSDRASWALADLPPRGGRGGGAASAAIVALGSCPTRQYRWSSVLSLRRGSAAVTGWCLDRRAAAFRLAAAHAGTHPVARSVALSCCGQLAVVGYSSGEAVVMRVQNRSVRRLSDAEGGGGGGGGGGVVRAHAASVECVEVVGGGHTVGVTAGLDGWYKVWGLREGRLCARAHTTAAMTQSCVHEAAAWLIVAHHHTIAVYSCSAEVLRQQQQQDDLPADAKGGVDGRVGEHTPPTVRARPVRWLPGHRAAITALALTPDTARHLLSAAGDGSLLLWDLAAATCVGAYRLPAPALSLSFHPDALFVASTHAGVSGAVVWVNHLRYGFVPEYVSQPEQRDVLTLPALKFPTTHGAPEEEEEEEEEEGDDVHPDTHEAAVSAPMDHVCPHEGTTAAKDEEQQQQQQQQSILSHLANDPGLRRRQRETEAWAALQQLPTAGLRLSGVSRAVWSELTLIDDMVAKNQPVLPPRRSDVPFFLPSTQELRPTFMLTAGGTTRVTGGHAGTSAQSREEQEEEEKVGNCGESEAAAVRSTSAAARRVHPPCADDARKDAIDPPMGRNPMQRWLLSRDYDAVMSHLRHARSARAVDAALRQVVDFVEGASYTVEELQDMRVCLAALLDCVAVWLQRGEDVDLVQGVLAAVMHDYGALLGRLGPEMAPALERVAGWQNEVRYKLDHLVSLPECLAGSASGVMF